MKPARPVARATFRHWVTSATKLWMDPEGFWQRGRRLSAKEVDQLNDAIWDDQAKVIEAGGDNALWIITLGRGLHYAVDPNVRCYLCRAIVWIDENHPSGESRHGACIPNKGER